MIENLGPIEYYILLKSYYEVEPQIKWPDVDKRQVGLQYKAGEDIWGSASGRRKGDEFLYDQLNPLFKGTMFEEVINTFNLKRTRLMWVAPKSCYSMHTDATPRIHIPLITNPDCYFVFKNNFPRFLAAGNVYKVDTRLAHTFMNCSNEPRLHLVGVVEK